MTVAAGADTAKSYPRTGAIAGAVSALVFTWIHDLLISDIWAMLVPMVVAGAACGASIGWSYRRIAAQATLAGWLRYNATYLVMFGFLGAASVVVFDPVTTMAAVVTANAPPDELIAAAMPMTIGFTFLTAALLTVLHGRRWTDFGPILVTVVVLVTFLGLNVSAIGLVAIPSGSLYLVAVLFGLVLVLDVVYAAVVALIERPAWSHERKSRAVAP